MIYLLLLSDTQHLEAVRDLFISCKDLFIMRVKFRINLFVRENIEKIQNIEKVIFC